MNIPHIILLILINTNICEEMRIHDNLLKNSGFEDLIVQEWQLKKAPGVQVLIDPLESYSGRSSIKIENFVFEEECHYGCNQIISAPPPSTWMSLKVAIKTIKLNGRAGIDVHFRDEEFKRIPKYDAAFSLRGKNLSRDWQVYTVDFSIPEGTKIILVALFIKGQGTVWFDNVTLSNIESEADLYKLPSKGAHILSRKEPIIWFEYADQKVYKETPLPKTKGKQKVEIAGAQNEWESFQFVIHPKSDLKDCYIRFKDLISKNGNCIEKEQLSYYPVGYVNIKQTSAANGVIGLNPDYLIKNNYFNLNAHKNNPIWIDLYIPKDAKTGNYYGNILLRKGNKTLAKIPLCVKVWDFQLPDKSHLHIKSHFDFNLIKKYDNRNTADILEDYYENLSAHRINIMDIAGPRAIIVDNKVKCSFEKFDNTIIELFEKYGYEAVTIGPFLGDATGWNYRLKWLGIDIGSEKFKQYFQQYCQQLEEYLKKKGWLDRCYIYYWDEPQITNPNFSGIVNIGKIIKESAPNLKIFMTKWPIVELYNIVDIWCLPFTPIYFDQEKISQRQQLGEKVIVYHNDPYIDTPLIDKRLYAWRYLKAGVDGVFAWWNITKWLDNPYNNPHITLPRNDGSTFPLKPGNGILLYPNQDGSGPPVNSIRWEIFREGLEDYEYLWLLKRNIKRALAHLKKNEAFIDFAEYRVKEIVNELVKDYFSKWTHDVKYLHEVRQRLAEEIQITYQRPYVLIKTIKQNKKDAIKVLGLTERGTRIFVNDKAITVTSNGSFFEETHLLDDGSILIRAEFGDREKIIKQFVKRIVH